MQKLNFNIELIFFLLLIYGLSFSIFLKELNVILLESFDFKIIYLYRGLIFLLSLIIFFKMEKSFNKWVFLILLINILFLYNVFLGNPISFKTESYNFFLNLNYSFHKSPEDNILLIQKNKFLIINIFNILIPLFVFSFMKKINMNIYEFKIISKNLCEIITTCLFLLVVFKYINNFINLNNDGDYKLYLINPHSMLYILNIHFLLILEKNFNHIKKINNKDYLSLFFIFLLIIATDSLLHALICFLTFLIYMVIRIKDKINAYYLMVIFVVFIFIIILFNLIFYEFDFSAPGIFTNSISIRINTLLYFLTETYNLNLLLGNNIFSKTLVTYPHNIFFDLFLCTGFIGLSVFTLLNIKLLYSFIKFKSDQENFFHLVFIQS